MAQTDICKFNYPTNKSKDSLSILQFYHKRDIHTEPGETTWCAAYRMHLVCRGSGTLQVRDKIYELQPGDLFLIFPETEYTFSSLENLEFYAITFVDLNANRLLSRVDMNAENFFLPQMAELLPQWELFFASTTPKNIDLMAESLVYYTFGCLCKLESVDQPVSTEKYVLELKEMAESRFHDPDLSLKAWCKDHGYNITYVSLAFKKIIGVTFWAYINGLRMSHAESLMQRGITSVKQISSECGFRSASYFSSAFKKFYGVSPKEYLLRKKNNETDC